MSSQDLEQVPPADTGRVTPVIDPGLPPEARDHLAREVGRADGETGGTAAGCGVMLGIAGAITLLILHFAAGVGWWWMLASAVPVTIGIVVATALDRRLADADAGHVIRAADLDNSSRRLMLRAQNAIRAILKPRECADSLDEAVTEPTLRRHEWEIAASLRDISKLRAAHKDSAGDDAPGPMTAAVLDSQRRALELATDSVTSRISRLERFAAELEMADMADRDWRAAAEASGRNDQYLDLVARTAADEHAVAEIKGLTERAAAAAQVFREHLHQASLAAQALVLPGDPEDEPEPPPRDRAK